MLLHTLLGGEVGFGVGSGLNVLQQILFDGQVPDPWVLQESASPSGMQVPLHGFGVGEGSGIQLPKQHCLPSLQVKPLVEPLQLSLLEQHFPPSTSQAVNARLSSTSCPLFARNEVVTKPTKIVPIIKSSITIEPRASFLFISLCL